MSISNTSDGSSRTALEHGPRRPCLQPPPPLQRVPSYQRRGSHRAATARRHRAAWTFEAPGRLVVGPARRRTSCCRRRCWDVGGCRGPGRRRSPLLGAPGQRKTRQPPRRRRSLVAGGPVSLVPPDVIATARSVRGDGPRQLRQHRPPALHQH